MKKIRHFFGLVIFSFVLSPAVAEYLENKNPKEIVQTKTMIEDQDGILTVNEYEVIDTKNSIFRALCPYTCQDRMIPRKFCKEWKSVQEPTQCYVQDIRIPSDAIAFPTRLLVKE